MEERKGIIGRRGEILEKDFRWKREKNKDGSRETQGKESSDRMHERTKTRGSDLGRKRKEKACEGGRKWIWRAEESKKDELQNLNHGKRER